MSSVPMMFLKLYVKGKPVNGESEVQEYEKQIVIDSMSWDVSAAQVKGENTEAHTEVRPEHLKLTKVFDRSSSVLYKAMVEKEKFTTATVTTLTMAMAGKGDKIPKVMTMQVFDGYIESIDASASGSGKSIAVKETLTLSFKKAKLMYYPPSTSVSQRAAPTTFELETGNVKGGA